MAGVDRGVSTVVGYVLNLGIATILITGLLISGASLVDQQRGRVAYRIGLAHAEELAMHHVTNRGICSHER